MTAADLDDLRYRAHAFEAQTVAGRVMVPQQMIRMWEKEILAFRSMTLEQFIEYSVTRTVVTP